MILHTISLFMPSSYDGIALHFFFLTCLTFLFAMLVDGVPLLRSPFTSFPPSLNILCHLKIRISGHHVITIDFLNKLTASVDQDGQVILG